MLALLRLILFLAYYCGDITLGNVDNFSHLKKITIAKQLIKLAVVVTCNLCV